MSLRRSRIVAMATALCAANCATIRPPVISRTLLKTKSKSVARLEVAGASIKEAAMIDTKILDSSTPSALLNRSCQSSWRGRCARREPCGHRPTGEGDGRWTRQTHQSELKVCSCCGGPVLPILYSRRLCPVCQGDRVHVNGSGHITRLALDLGARFFMPNAADAMEGQS